MRRIIKISIVLSFVFAAFNSNAQIRIVLVDNANGMLWVKNFGPAFVDIAGYRFTAGLSYAPALTSLTFQGGGTPIGPTNARVITGFVLNNATTGSDLALYLPDGGLGSAEFSDPSYLVDFMQYGSAGNGYESTAVSKGVWGAGTFVAGTPAYNYVGNGSTENGAQYWNGNPSSVVESTVVKNISLYPNPAQELLNIDLKNNTQVTSYMMVNILGETVLESNSKVWVKDFTIDVSKLSTGEYFLMLNSGNEHKIEKIIIK